MAKQRAKMPIAQRAKQFMPFKAVAGLDEALRKKEQEIDRAVAMGEDPASLRSADLRKGRKKSE